MLLFVPIIEKLSKLIWLLHGLGYEIGKAGMKAV